MGAVDGGGIPSVQSKAVGSGGLIVIVIGGGRGGGASAAEGKGSGDGEKGEGEGKGEHYLDSMSGAEEERSEMKLNVAMRRSNIATMLGMELWWTPETK